MVIIKGCSAAPGAALGWLHFLGARHTGQRGGLRTAAQEMERLARAQQQAAGELESLAQACRREGRREAAELLDAHLLLLADEDFSGAVRKALEAGAAAEQAVQRAGEAFAARLAALPDPYLQARAADVRDVAERLQEALAGRSGQPELPDTPFILAAQDLPPSLLIGLRDAPVQGIALQAGSPRGHTAILAKGMGIPAVFGLGRELDAACNGREALLDGDGGALLLEPDEASRSEMAARQRTTQSRGEAVRGLADETRGGQRLDILCSAASVEDCRRAVSGDGGGVGLLRSELLFLNREHPPEEALQLKIYRQAVQALGGRRLVIRLMDLGADKQAAWLPLPREENPALGLRGIRLSLAHPELLRTQLRAVCRASARGPVALLLPMITSPVEVRVCRERLRAVQEELAAEGLPFDRNMPLGVMIETPAAVMTAPEIAHQADFLSIGTNDLAQYILACDRQAPPGQQLPRTHHPAVFRSMRLVASAAHRAGKRVGVCGDMGAEAALLPFFLSIGADEVTVPPSSVLPLRAALRALP